MKINSRFNILLALVSFPVIACPDLGGLHTNCRQSDGTITKVRIVKSEENAIARFKIDWSGKRTQIHITDGVTRETPIFDTGMTLRKTSFCEGNFLKHFAVMTDASGAVKLDVTEEYSLVNKRLHFRALDENGVYNEIVCR